MILRQATSQVVRIGPFVDSTDGVTPEPGLTIANTDVKLSKDGGAFANKNSGGATADGSNGWYSMTLDATDTATVGILEVEITESGALPVFKTYYVVEEAVYDALYGASAAGPLQSTTAARTLDVNANGNAGIDWNNVDNQNAVVDLSATDFQLVDTVTTCTTTTTNTDMLTAAAVNAEVDTALSDIGLDHLISASVTGTDVADDSIIAFMVSKSVTADWDSYDNTSHSLENAYTNIGLSGNSLTSLPWNLAWDAEVESECNDALVALHLDHLLAVDYDPASKPGVATALLNELIESNAGVSRYTAAALAQAPSGGGTVDANIVEILGTAVTETNAGDSAESFSFFWDVDPVTTKTVNDVGVAGAGLTSQNVRDAMKLAPTAGAPTALSVDAHLDDILADVTGINGDAMRGTDSALLAASSPTNFGDLAITVTTGLVSVGTLPTIPTNWLTADGLATDAVAEIADQVWEEANGDHMSGSTFGGIVGQTYTTTGTINVNVGTAGAGLTDLAGISNISSLVVSAGGAVDSMVQGFLNNTIAETSPDNISANFETFMDNADALTAQTVDDVGGGGGGGDATAANQTTIINAIGTMTDLGGGADVANNLADMAGATFSTATDSQEAIRNRGDAAWITGAGGTPPQLLQSTTIATLASQTSFTLTAGSADDDAYNGVLCVITDASTSTQKALGRIDTYTGATKTVVLAVDPGIYTMAVGDTIELLATDTAVAYPNGVPGGTGWLG